MTGQPFTDLLEMDADLIEEMIAVHLELTEEATHGNH